MKRQQKIATVKTLREKLSRAKAIVLVDYRGMTMKHLDALRKGLRSFEAEFTITKNTLLKKALEEEKKLNDTIANTLKNPTASLFMYGDEIAPLKELAKIIKNFQIPQIKLGIMEGNMLTSDDVIRLSSLPTKNILYAQVVGNIKAPLFGLVYSLNWNIQKLVRTLAEVQKKKTN